MRDYLAGAGEAPRFYRGSPGSLASFRAKLREVEGRFGPAERQAAARALRPTSARAAERLERFVREGGAVVTTGQQAGFLTGPLYTVYKALTVVRLAESLERELGCIVLPVFWTASEDHDWAEANHAYLLGEGDVVRRLELPSADPRQLPMSERRLEDGVRGILDDLAQIVSGLPFAGDLLTLLRSAYRPGATVAGAFSETMASLFEPFDLLLTDAADPHLKRASAPLLRQALLDSEGHEEVLRRRTEELLAAGYHGQVAVLPEGTNLFYHGEGERERLYRHPRGFLLQDRGKVIEETAILAELEADPGRFSPNVLLRPVVESAVFPTLAYVGGPGETAYFAQITALFDEVGIGPPVVYPRWSALLVEPAIQHIVDRHSLSLGELALAPHEVASRVAARLVPAGVREGLDRVARSIAEGYRELIEEAARVDPGLAGTLGSLRNASLADLRDGETRILRRVKEREKATLAQVMRARAHLCPEGEPQERLLGPASFLARYGRGLLRDLAAAVETPWMDEPTPAVQGAAADLSSR